MEALITKKSCFEELVSTFSLPALAWSWSESLVLFSLFFWSGVWFLFLERDSSLSKVQMETNESL